MHHIDVFGELRIKLLLAEIVLGNCRIHVLFENVEVFRLRFSDLLDKLDQLREVEEPDVVFILSHSLQNTANNLTLLLRRFLKAVQNI